MHSTSPWLSCAAALALGACAAQPGPSAADIASQQGNGNVLNVADAAIASGNPDMALKVSQTVLATDPNNLDALYHEAAAYYAFGRCEDSIAAYKVALGLDPKSSDAETGIGRCLLKRNASEAEQAFAAAVADDPGNAAALNDLGIARDMRGDFAGATQPYQQALLIAPGNLSTEVNLGLSLALSGDPGDALQYLGPLATGEDATPKIREDYATALLGAGRSDEARQVLAIDIQPGQLDQAMATLSALIAATQAPAPPAPAPAPADAAAAPVALLPTQAAPATEAAASPATVPPPPNPTPMAQIQPAPVQAAPAQAAPVDGASQAASPAPAAPMSPSLPLADTAPVIAPPRAPASSPSGASIPLADMPLALPFRPVAPPVIIAMAPALAAPGVIPPPAPDPYAAPTPLAPPAPSGPVLVQAPEPGHAGPAIVAANIMPTAEIIR